METTNIVDFARRDEMTDALTDLRRTGAQQLIATAVEAEFAGYLAQFADLRTETGHSAVVRNGHHPERLFRYWHWPCERAHSKGPSQGWHTGNIPICLGAALCA